MGYHVSINTRDTYDDQMVRKAIGASLAPLGGLESVITDGDRVPLK